MTLEQSTRRLLSAAGAQRSMCLVRVEDLHMVLKEVTFCEKYVRVALPPRMIDDGETASLHIGSW